MAHLPNLKEWTIRGAIRWVATFVGLGLITVLIDENYRTFFEEYHLNKLWKWTPDMLPDVSLLPEPHWLWFDAGLSSGIALALWIIKLFPASKPKALPTRVYGVQGIRSVGLEIAASTMYGEIGNCPLRDLIDTKSNNKPDTIIEIAARIIADHTDIYGVRPPSSISEMIDKNDLKRLKMKRDGHLQLQLIDASDSSRVVYYHLTVNSDDLARASDKIMTTKDNPMLQIGQL